MKVYYLGPEGTFSYRVAKKVFPEEELIACKDLIEIADKITTDSYGILPLENSTSCNVHQSIDLILDRGFQIIEENFLEIEFTLVGMQEAKLEQINKIFAHPMALSQCCKIVNELNLDTEGARSNIHAQEMLLEYNDPNIAAISNNHLISDKLKYLKSNIADSKNNLSRFVAITKDDNLSKRKGNKITALMMIPHQPGSLAKILNQMADHDLNLAKIESRPIPGTHWEYKFWLDIEIKDFNLEEIHSLLEPYTSELNIIGYYQARAFSEKDILQS